MAMGDSSRLLVVGGGAFGLSTALAAVGHFDEILVLDRLPIPAIDGAPTCNPVPD